VAQNLIDKSGSWYSYKGDRIGQGRENARQFLKDNQDIRRQVDLELRQALGMLKKEPEAAASGQPEPAMVGKRYMVTKEFTARWPGDPSHTMPFQKRTPPLEIFADPDKAGDFVPFSFESRRFEVERNTFVNSTKRVQAERAASTS